MYRFMCNEKLVSSTVLLMESTSVRHRIDFNQASLFLKAHFDRLSCGGEKSVKFSPVQPESEQAL